jgi:hypothetical protein
MFLNFFLKFFLLAEKTSIYGLTIYLKKSLTKNFKSYFPGLPKKLRLLDTNLGYFP